MKIYLISRQRGVYEDEFASHVIAANDDTEARNLAKEGPGFCFRAEDPQTWDLAKMEEIGEYTGEKTTPFFVLSEYRNA